MDRLRTELRETAELLPRKRLSRGGIATLAPGLRALLLQDTLYIVRSGYPPVSVQSDDIPEDASWIVPGRCGALAVVGPRGICVVDGDGAVVRVGRGVFETRPELKVLQVAWAVGATKFLMVLTNDGSLRLFDVVSNGSAEVPRLRLRVVTGGAGPVAFAFGRGSAWDALAVYVLAGDGGVYVASPIAPVGTKVSEDSWQRMREASKRVVARERGGGEDEEEPTGRAAWALRQAEMQVRFLDSVFEKTGTGEMVAVREFKPAPLLFQGPLFVEHDDVDEVGGDDDQDMYCSLVVLNSGPSRPPVLLRSTTTGDVSVLVALEAVEAQWFLSDDKFAIRGDAALEASDEYAESARTVAPLLLCFEHLSFPGNSRAELFTLGGDIDADVMFAVVDASVYSVRLSFLSVLDNVTALESTPASTIALLMSTRVIASHSHDSQGAILGLTPTFEKGSGPVAIVLTQDGELLITGALRWTLTSDTRMPARLLGAEPSAQAMWSTERPTTGSRAFACPELGKEVVEAMRTVSLAEEQQGWTVATGSLGTLSSAKSVADILGHLEARVAAYTGTATAPGVGDTLGGLASTLTEWTRELKGRARGARKGIEVVDASAYDADVSAETLQRKARRVAEFNTNLSARIATLRECIRLGSTDLTRAERERLAKLSERKRRVNALRRRLLELTAAVHAATSTATVAGGLPQSTGSRMSAHVSGAASPMSKSRRWSASPGLKAGASPLERRRPEWSVEPERVELGPIELRQTKMALEKHSKEIADATESCTALWRRFAAA